MDYSKQEIADEIGVSRNTVDYHLEKIREDVENHETPEMALAEFLFEPEELLPFLAEEVDNPLDHMDLDDLAIPLRKLGEVVGSNDE